MQAILIGDESLAVDCGTLWLARGHGLGAVVTLAPGVADWARAQGLRVVAPGEDLAARLAGLPCDWIVSITNPAVLSAPVLALARRGGVSFHDGPLPRHPGLNAPVWAILSGDMAHGITWHRLTGRVGDGAILVQRMFTIGAADTAQTLHARCAEAAVKSFPDVIRSLETGGSGRPQDGIGRTLHRRADRPRAAGRLSFDGKVRAVVDLVRGLDHGDRPNPVATAKIDVAGRILAVGQAVAAAGAGLPGTVLSATPEGLVVACADGAVRLSGLRDMDGRAVCPSAIGVARLSGPDAAEAGRIDAALAAAARAEAAVGAILRSFDPLRIGADNGDGVARWSMLPVALPGDLPCDRILPVLALGLRRIAGGGVHLAWHGGPSAMPGIFTDWVPLAVADGTLAAAEAALAADVAAARLSPGFARDLALRDARIGRLRVPPVALSDAGALPGSAVTLALAGAGAVLHHDAARLDTERAARLVAHLECLAAAIASAPPGASMAELPGAAPDPSGTTPPARDHGPRPHRVFEARAAHRPDALALVADHGRMTLHALNARANRAAHVLRGMGVGPGVPVGLCAGPSFDMAEGALAILKAGGTPVPMDPARRADPQVTPARPVVVTRSAVAGGQTAQAAQLVLDADPRLAAAPDTNPPGNAGHPDLSDAFAAMDHGIGPGPGVWLSVDPGLTETIWALSRGFTVVLASDAGLPPLPAAGVPAKGVDVSLSFPNAEGPDDFRLLMEAARFADAHGLAAVWIGGGPAEDGPNPAVTAAAVAAATARVAVRGGASAATRHDPARIAADWAAIGTLSGGRAGLAVASSGTRHALADAIGLLRRHGQGGADAIPPPRPATPDLPVWVAACGDTGAWRRAGRAGAHVLTGLEGRTVAEMGHRIGIYRQALRAAGHEPAAFAVTLELPINLFGEVEDARARVAELGAAGVTEVACRIDPGMGPDAVRAALDVLAQVVAAGPVDASVAARIARHGVTHLHCTTAVARMILSEDAARAALAGVGTLVLGGGAPSSALVAALGRATGARILTLDGRVPPGPVAAVGNKGAARDGLIDRRRALRAARGAVPCAPPAAPWMREADPPPSQPPGPPQVTSPRKM